MTTELSTSIEAAPIAWVESLFARMTACYGAKFADMWRDADMNLVKSLWAQEMGKLTNEELKHGYQSLMTKAWSPTLPEYVQLCKSLPRKEAAHVMQLPAPKDNFSKEDAAKRLAELGATELLKPKTDHKLWAKRIIERSKHPLHGYSALQIRFAKEALANKAV
ncbi:MAG: hypothetical protein ACXU8A_00170 [Burkholderiaceae bacterium]